MAYHSLLDWRLAVDMARLALDPLEPLSLASPPWRDVADVAARTLEAARPAYSRTVIADLPAVSDGADVIFVTHPLWQTGETIGPELAAAWDEAERVHGLTIDPEGSFISVFEALRRPCVKYAGHHRRYQSGANDSNHLVAYCATRADGSA